jgi:two-component system, NarL family, sensor histidine kinase DevS
MTEQTDSKRADPPSLGLTPLSRVRLDELLQEMLDRVGDVMASRERLRALLDAVVGIGTDLDLRSTLQHHPVGVRARRSPLRRPGRHRRRP